MRRLRSTVDHAIEALAPEQIENRVTVTDIDVEMCESRGCCKKLITNPRGVAFGPKELSPHVVVDTDGVESCGIEVPHRLGTDQPAGTCDKQFTLQDVLPNLFPKFLDCRSRIPGFPFHICDLTTRSQGFLRSLSRRVTVSRRSLLLHVLQRWTPSRQDNTAASACCLVGRE